MELKRITGNEKEELMDAFHKNIELMKSIVKLKKENERAQSGGATGRKEEDEEDAIGTIRTSCETIIKTCLEKDAFVEAITVVLDEYKNLDGVVQIDDDEEFFKDKSDDAIVNSMRFPKFDFATKVDSAFKKKLTEKKYQNVNGYRDKDGHLMMRQFEDAIKEPAEEGASKDGEIEFVGNHSSEKFKCPITRSSTPPFMKNRTCNHTYSKIGIMDAIQRGRGSCACPVAGCTQTVTRSTLVRDRDTEEAVKAWDDKERIREKKRTRLIKSDDEDSD